METLSKKLWKRIAEIFPSDDVNFKAGNALFRQYEAAGHLTPGDISCYEIPVIADFFRRISLIHSAESPILRRRDPRWMSQIDYSRVNIRGTGMNEKTGSFITAALFITQLRTEGIILAPITNGPTDNLEILSSHIRIRTDLEEPGLTNAGFSLELQAAAFCEAAHLLGFVIGWETDYRVDTLAPVVLNKPELFLWNEHGKSVSNKTEQSRLCNIVRQEVAILKQRGLMGNRSACRSALKHAGIEVSTSGDDNERTALSFHSPETGETNPMAIDYWSRTFDNWRDKFGFDFLVLKGLKSIDVPDMNIAAKAADTARKGGVRRCIGVAAEGNPKETELFGENGVDMVIARDALEPADKDWFSKVFELDGILKQVNRGRKLKFSVPLEVNPGENGTSEEQSRALIKRFTARFLGLGDSRRPLLETMGAMDGAWGFENSIRHKINIKPSKNPMFSIKAHLLKDTACKYKKMLNKGELTQYEVDNRKAWWIIESRYGMLIAVVSVENENRLPPGPLDIPPFNSSIVDNMTLLEYDFMTAGGILHLDSMNIKDTNNISYGEFRLYVVE